jgi:hypothetical protein
LGRFIFGTEANYDLKDTGQVKSMLVAQDFKVVMTHPYEARLIENEADPEVRPRSG